MGEGTASAITLKEHRRALQLAVFVSGCLLLLIVILTLATLALCGGHLVYTLDDPYISLTLGAQISHGHYGLNSSEFSSPSSSILYPLILAVFARLPEFDWIPLLINSAAAAGTATCLAHMFAHYSAIDAAREFQRTSVLIVSLCIVTGIVGVVFTGLEHSIHVLLSVLIVYGVARTLEDGAAPRWLVWAVVLAPLIRFEGLALSGLAILSFMIVRQWRIALISLGAIFAGLAVDMALMACLGLPLLPSSVLLKASFITPAAAHSGSFLTRAISNATNYPPARFLWVLTTLVTLHPVWRLRSSAPQRFSFRAEILFIVVIFGAVIAHVLFGAWGWWFRYEVYIGGISVAATIVLWGSEVNAFISRAPSVSFMAVVLMLFCLNIFYVGAAWMNPLAARGIYEQQYQIHRFAVDFYRRAVAVNDIGWVSFQNPNYVLDLWGLGSEDARKARLVTHRPGWMDRLTREHGVGVAIIYSDWFQGNIPPSWQQIARLRATHAQKTAGRNEVEFYATSEAAIPDALAALRHFSGTIDGVAALTVKPGLVSLGQTDLVSTQ